MSEILEAIHLLLESERRAELAHRMQEINGLLSAPFRSLSTGRKLPQPSDRGPRDSEFGSLKS